MKAICALTVTLLIIGVRARPSPQQRHGKSLADFLSHDVSSSEELLLLESMEDLGLLSSGPRPRDSPLPADSAQIPHGRAWLRLFSDFLSNQKKFRGRTRKSGSSRGCFGMKLERMGAVSGLGC